MKNKQESINPLNGKTYIISDVIDDTVSIDEFVSKNNKPVITPCATIPIIAALIPIGVKDAIPSITKPIWPTDEKAIRRFKSVWAKQANDP